MDERTWVNSVQELVSKSLSELEPNLAISQGANLPYANEIVIYNGSGVPETKPISYETDLLVFEKLSEDRWKPRIVIECKLESVTTHDAITYSEKAFTHKRVHPYLRYGILLGARAHYPIPGRLVRHGAYFDFMLSWVSCTPSEIELRNLLDVLLDEVRASRELEEILYSSRSPNRKRYIVLHRPLRLRE